MGTVDTLGLLLGASYASGINLYATVATLGLLNRFEIVDLPKSLEVLSHPVVLGVAVLLYIVEFFADKIPIVDTIWDSIHTFIRPPAAAVLAFAGVGDVPEIWKLGSALLAGSVALAAHGTKATTRLAVQASPEPVSNIGLSLGEDVFVVLLVYMAVTHPVITAIIALLLLCISVYVLVKFYGFLKRVVRRVFRRKPTSESPSTPSKA